MKTRDSENKRACLRKERPSERLLKECKNPSAVPAHLLRNDSRHIHTRKTFLKQTVGIVRSLAMLSRRKARQSRLTVRIPRLPLIVLVRKTSSSGRLPLFIESFSRTVRAP